MLSFNPSKQIKHAIYTSGLTAKIIKYDCSKQNLTFKIWNNVLTYISSRQENIHPKIRFSIFTTSFSLPFVFFSSSCCIGNLPYLDPSKRHWRMGRRRCWDMTTCQNCNWNLQDMIKLQIKTWKNKELNKELNVAQERTTKGGRAPLQGAQVILLHALSS